MTSRTTTYKDTVGASQKGALTICLILGTLVSGFSEAQPITTFDAPGAGTGAGQGTFAININGFGVAVGYFVDANIVPHGFVRSPFGQVTTIDTPGAGMVPGANQGTVAESINIEGAIAGQYQDANFVLHCFLRYPDGHIITFDAPRAGTGPNQGSVAVGINLEGTIAGYSIDNNNVQHGFVRSPLGTFTSFDAPDAGTGTISRPLRSLLALESCRWQYNTCHSEFGDTLRLSLGRSFRCLLVRINRQPISDGDSGQGISHGPSHYSSRKSVCTVWRRRRSARDRCGDNRSPGAASITIVNRDPTPSLPCPLRAGRDFLGYYLQYE